MSPGPSLGLYPTRYAKGRPPRLVADEVPSQTQQQTLRKLDDVRLREIVAGFTAALERGDADALVALLTEDVTWSMPPLPHWYHGLEAVADFAVRIPLSSCGSWRHLPTSANGQPAVGCYLWNDDAGTHLAWSINVLTLRGERIAEVNRRGCPAGVRAPDDHAILGSRPAS